MKILTREEVEQAARLRSDYDDKATATAVKVEEMQALDPAFVPTAEPEPIPESASDEFKALYTQLQDLKTQAQAAAQLTDVKGNWFIFIQEIIALRKEEREHPRPQPEPDTQVEPQA